MSQPDSPVTFDDLLAHRGWVRALARRLVGDASRADDVEQEVWLTALRRPPTHARSLRAWIGRVVRSRAQHLCMCSRGPSSQGAIRASASSSRSSMTSAER